MKKTLLVCAAALTFTSCSSVPSKNTDNDLTPVQITEISSGSFPKRQFDNESDKTRYSDFAIDSCTLFYRCMSDIMLVGYALEPTGFNTIGYKKYIFKECDFTKFKQDITIDDVKRAETEMSKCVYNDKLDLEPKFKNIKTRYKEYGRQYVFFYNKKGDLCVLINCCCGKSKYNWLFSKQYFIVDDGGDCYWKMFINLDKGLLISYYINGEA